jgi:hypothetical protein
MLHIIHIFTRWSQRGLRPAAMFSWDGVLILLGRVV